MTGVQTCALPIFCTYPDYIPTLVDITNRHFMDIIGTQVGLKIKTWQPEPLPRAKDINEEWIEIKPVVTLQDYKKIAHKIIPSNIERANHFLSQKR